MVDMLARSSMEPDLSESITEFPTLEPLSHDLSLLSPLQAVEFSVDDFLLSRTKASDLNFILSDLRTFNEKLKNELFSIINEDYKDFVSLGSSLKAESHRISRLGWKDVTIDSDVPAGGLMAPIRETLVSSRDTLQGVQDDIKECMQLRGEADAHKARLELMLQLHDSIARLEDLLLIPSSSSASARRRSVHHRHDGDRSGSAERRGSATTLSESDDDLSDYAVSSEYDDLDEETAELSEDQEPSDYLSIPLVSQKDVLLTKTQSLATSPAPLDETTSSPLTSKKRRRRILRRFSTGFHGVSSNAANGEPISPTRSFASGRKGSDVVASTSSSLLGLPQRIARTSAEYSRLRFLSRKVQEEGLAAFSSVVVDRIAHIRLTLRQDLRALLRSLLSPSSLMVHGSATTTLPASPDVKRNSRSMSPTARRSSFLKSHASRSSMSPSHPNPELDNWTQVAEPIGDSSEAQSQYWEARIEEQRSWLEMGLAALQSLADPPSNDSQDENVPARDEATEAVRELMIQDWASKTISVSSMGQDHIVMLDQLSAALLKHFEESRNRVASVLLPEDPQDNLVNLYNTILRYVALTAWQVCDAAEHISSQSTRPSAGTERDASTCNVFIDVVWDEISSKLLEEVGSQIFFVGRPDAFYRNFSNTNLFLQRLVSLAPSQRAAAAITAHPNWSAFKKRWQLPVYFQMRFREVITRLEEAFTNGREVAEDQGRMQATLTTMEAVKTLWSDGVHIHELSAREWRVTLQILSRYKTWIEEQLPDGMSTYASNGVANKLLDGVQGADASRERGASSELSRVGTPQPAPDQPTQQQEDTQLRLLASLVSDCVYLQEQMNNVLDSVILARISGVVNMQDSADVDSLRADLGGILSEESFDFVPGLILGAGRMVFNILLPRTVEPLRMLRSFSTPSYRASGPNTGKTSAPSAIVQVIHQIFAPLQSYLRMTAVYPLPKNVQRKWVEHVLDDTFRRFAGTIETNSKNQQSLNRLKKSQPPSSGLLGYFKSSTAPTSAASEGHNESSAQKSTQDLNTEAIDFFETKLVELDLDIDLGAFEAWIRLKSFLQSQSEDT